MPPRTPGKVVLYHKETGEEFERWPVDAREMLALPDSPYVLDDPDALKPRGARAPDPVPHKAEAEAAVAHDPHAVMARAEAGHTSPEPPKPPAPEPEVLSWPLATPPDQYLERWPNGPQADLARAILNQQGQE